MLLTTGAPAETGEPRSAVERLAWVGATLEKGSVFRQQKALTMLGEIPGPEADRLLLMEYERLQAGTLPAALWLELLEAMEKRGSAEWRGRLAERARGFAGAPDQLLRWRECLEGGDSESGRAIFFEKVEAGCARCHTVSGKGGAIGPDLTDIGSRSDRVNILESMVFPSAVIAPGFENVLLTLKDGEVVNGIRSFEGRDEMVVTSVIDGSQRRIPTAQIAESTALPSAMPPGLGEILSKRALRDLVEFLAGGD